MQIEKNYKDAWNLDNLLVDSPHNLQKHLFSKQKGNGDFQKI